MQTIALYGAGQKSLLAEQRLRIYATHLKAKYLIENKQFAKLGTVVPTLGSEGEALQVISLAALKELYDSGQCHKVLIPCAYHLFDLREARQNLQKLGFRSEDILAMPYNRLAAPLEVAFSEAETYLPYDDLNMIYHLDVHVVDHCNLKCKACAHFSSLVDEEVIYPVDTVAQSITRLSSMVPNISSISLLGGEPLLHPDLPAIITSTRNAYPYAAITLVTNGILLPQASSLLVETCKQHNITLVISLYPPMQDEVDNIVQRLKSAGINWNMQRIDAFERRFTPQCHCHEMENFHKCGHIMCLRGARLGYCVIALFTDYYNKCFGAHALPEDAGMDIFSVQSGQELLTGLQQPLDLCRQCVSRDAGEQYWKPWEPAGVNPGANDWFIAPAFESVKDCE